VFARGSFFEKLRRLLGYFFNTKIYVFILKNGLGFFLDDFFSQTHLVAMPKGDILARCKTAKRLVICGCHLYVVLWCR
jgi:hypothetical protein